MGTIAYPDRFERDGIVTKTPNRPHGLLEALATSWADETTDPEEIELRGALYGMTLCGDAGKAIEVARQAPINVRIQGPGANDLETFCGGWFSENKGGGIHRLSFRDLRFALNATKYPICMNNNPKRSGRVAFRRCKFVGNPKVYSHVRLYGMEVVAVSCEASDVKEYFLYFLHGRGVRGHATLKNCRVTRCGRGAIQAAERNMESDGNWQTHRKPSEDEVLEIDGLTAIDCGWEGSSAISITGHPGTVRARNLHIRSPHPTGAIYVRWDAKQNEQEPIPAGGWKYARAVGLGKINVPSLRAHRDVVLDLRGSVIDLPQTDREPILVDSCEALTVVSDVDTVVSSPRAAMSLEENGAGTVKIPTGFPNAGDPIASKAITRLVMHGTFGGWERTSGWQASQVFMRRNQAFDPAEYFGGRLSA